MCADYRGRFCVASDLEVGNQEDIGSKSWAVERVKVKYGDAGNDCGVLFR